MTSHTAKARHTGIFSYSAFGRSVAFWRCAICK